MIPTLLLAAVCSLQFDAPRAYDVPSTWVAEKIEVADLDGDGNLDLVVTNEFAYIRYGSRSGRFGDAIVLPARKAVVADVDRDRQPDLVVEHDSPTGPKVALIRNLGNRRFGEPREVYGGGAEGMAAGDFTNDGAPDVLLTQRTGQPAFLLNDGRGGLELKWGAAPALGAEKNLRTGDFNGDGNLDLAADRNPGTRLFLGNGTGYLAEGPPLGEHRYLLAVADLDRDGKHEAVTMGDLSTGIAVWRGDTATETTFGKDGQPFAATAGDFNGDGWPDLAASTYFGLQVLLNDRTGRLVPAGEPLRGVTSWRAMAAGDFDRDGKEDLVVGAGTGIAILRGRGHGTFASYPEIAPVVASFIADVDGNGVDERIVVLEPGEIVVVRGDAVAERITAAGSERIPEFWDPIHRQLLTRRGDELQVHVRRANGEWTVRHTVQNVTARNAILADFTGDGVNEIAVIVTGVAPSVRVISAATGATLFQSALRAAAAHFVRSADVNGDGLTDLIAVTAGSNASWHHDYEPAADGEINVYFSTGQSFMAPLKVLDRRAFHDVQRGDFNGDGAGDLLVTDYVGDLYVVWGSNTGNITTTLVIDSSEDFPPFLAEVADIDGDGFDDFVAPQPQLILRIFTGSASGLVDRGGFFQPSSFTTADVMRMQAGKPAAILLRDEEPQQPLFYLLQPTCAPARRRGVRK